ncbi:MAG: pyrroline-5-carboxylate reductase [Acidobacteriota bacterium]|nr:pyrroline-5-carboxylate reductase [Acidobacteriota bacterium]
MENILKKSKLAFIGCGVMAESMIKGLLDKKLVGPTQISASHPRAERREELKNEYSINVFEGNGNAVSEACSEDDAVVLLCVKPQRLNRVLKDIAGCVSKHAVVISIVAGATSEAISNALGTEKVVRCMPNTPSQIGRGMAVWTCTDSVTDGEQEKVKTLLSALGREMHVENEHMIDMATSLSATGPTYTFLVMEALTDAGVHLGFSREMSKELVQETMLGAVLFAMDSHLHPAELRNMVTSPGGTSADAIYQMEKGGLRTVLSKAVYSAYKRAVELGKEE